MNVGAAIEREWGLGLAFRQRRTRSVRYCADGANSPAVLLQAMTTQRAKHGPLARNVLRGCSVVPRSLGDHTDPPIDLAGLGKSGAIRLISFASGGADPKSIQWANVSWTGAGQWQLARLPSHPPRRGGIPYAMLTSTGFHT